MKRILFILITVVGLSSTSCDKDSEGLNYDFSNSLPPYAAVSVDAPAVLEGEDASFIFEVRTAIQEPVTITYDVSGAVNETGKTIEIPKGETSVDFSIPTAGLIPSGEEATSATVTLQKAVTSSGVELRLGSLNDSSPQTATIDIFKE